MGQTWHEPAGPRDQRTEWAYIFGAICPAKGKGAGLVMPWCDTDAMAAHLIEISAAVELRGLIVFVVFYRRVCPDYPLFILYPSRL